MCKRNFDQQKTKEMKKSIVTILLAVSVLIMSSCGYYTCATYSKAAPNKAVKATRI